MALGSRHLAQAIETSDASDEPSTSYEGRGGLRDGIDDRIMLDRLINVRRRLADLPVEDLAVLSAITSLRPAPSPGLLAWIEHAADWELHRRRGVDFVLQPPEEAVDASEEPIAVNAAIALHDQSVMDTEAIRAFLMAVAGYLTGRGQRQ